MNEFRPFALFGMGPRRKLLLGDGRLHDALTGELLRQWDVAEAHFELHEYRVRLTLTGGAEVTLWEDERATWLAEEGRRECVSEGEVRLPRFDGCAREDTRAHATSSDGPACPAHAPLLRRLHHEMLVNLVDGAPLPNLLVYRKPWYRDAAMVAMCLAHTGNLPLLRDWVMNLREPYDRNNAGHCEPDNLGQAMVMIALVGGRDHPLLPVLLAEAERRREGDHICGITDGAEHPVYQTKWLKLGLRSLGLPDPWVIPQVEDSYSALFWMAFTDEHVPGEPFSDRSAQLYPYLKWAEAHFHRWPPPWSSSLQFSPLPLGEGPGVRGPLTWEAHASEADYSRLSPVGDEYVAARFATPHTWHAAEMFLYLLDQP